MLRPPLSSSPLIDNWIERHRHRGSLVLHMIGIPVSIVGLLLLPIALPTLSPAIFLLALGLFFLGFLFQFLGHALERSEPGEVFLLRRRFGYAEGETAPRGLRKPHVAP